MTDGTAGLFLAGLGLGFIWTLAPGPINADALRRGALSGPRAACAVRFGSLAGVVLWATVAFAGGAVVLSNQPAYLVLNALGAALLLWISANSLTAFVRERPVCPGAIGRGSETGGFASGVLLTLLSPLEGVFWLANSGSVLTATTPVEQASRALMFLAGIVLSDVLATAGFWVAIACGRRHLNPVALRWAQLLSGGAVGYLGLRLAVATLSSPNYS